MAQSFHLLRREKASLGKRAVQTGAAMALGKNKTVTIRIRRILGIDLHLFEIQIRKQVRRGEGAAGMARFCVKDVR